MTFVLPEMSFHSWSDKSQGLDMSNFLAQVMPKFTENFGMTLLESAHVERLKFAGMEMNQHFWQNIGHFFNSKHFSTVTTILTATL